MKERFKKLVEFSPAFDKRNSDPKKNYGIGSVRIRFTLIGELGAVYFIMSSNFYTESVIKDNFTKPFGEWQPLPLQVGYHSPYPHFEGQSICKSKCQYLNNKPCYSDCSFLQADKVYQLLLSDGDKGVWKYLTSFYKYIFTNSKEKEINI